MIIFTLDFVKTNKLYQTWFIRMLYLINLIFLNWKKANTKQTWEIMKNIWTWKNTTEIQESSFRSANAKMVNWIYYGNIWLSLARELGSSFTQTRGGILVTPWTHVTFHPWPCMLKERCSHCTMLMQGISTVWAAVRQRLPPFIPHLPRSAWHRACQWF